MPLQRSEIEVRNAVFRAQARYAPMYSNTSHRGRKKITSAAELLDKIFHVCRTGCPWRGLERNGGAAPMTVYHYFNLWSKRRVFEKAFEDLATTYMRTSPAKPLVVDTSFVKNIYGVEVVGRNPTDRGRKATKVSLLCDERGAPLHVCYHKANKSDCQTLGHLLSSAASKYGPLSAHGELLADKGYDSAQCRSLCASHSLQQLIPKRRAPQDRVLNGRRCVVERVFGQIDRFRRVIVRYDAKMHSFRSFHALACSMVLSRVSWPLVSAVAPRRRPLLAV
jgi:transposase